jgi:uncharacterized protein YqeY
MSLQAKVVEDWKLALKNKDPKKDALSLIITELKNRAIRDNISQGEGRVVLDSAAQEVLQKMAKQRREAIEAYQGARRLDLVAKEELELSVIESYLPKPVNDDELRNIVAKAIKDVGATSSKDMGKVMGAVIKAVQGRADGKRIQSVVQNLLPGE